MIWEDQAACIDADPDVFFPEHAGDERAAKVICARCPVRTECLTVALSEDIGHGVWGGLTPHERTRIRRSAGSSLASVLRRWACS